ncbi:trans-aconitate 2-methyltransferase [Novosphingobium sp. TCA1]|uniref:class I SAM-dependent methyltransferase n=1 Tax=Novosphingobium sp. TCA1 TaxID=2682474 RepID=UPI00130931F7|nr:class I SAM-dependent methyltransferase [Novosphingobium sp. TCA1]GFE77273.1 methyltransferase [Novosphingobium sp. TCA1]
MTDAKAGAENIIPLYERTAAAWLAARGTDLAEAEWLDLLTERLEPGATILDLGCGGGVPIGAELLCRGFAVTGLDSAPSLIAHARTSLPQGEWIVGDMRCFAPPHRFDGLIAWHSFFHLGHDDQRAMIPRFARLLCPGGTVMFTSGPQDGVSWGEWQGESLFHASLSQQEYRERLVNAGFSAITYIEADPIGSGPTLWLATLGIGQGNAGRRNGA